MVRTVVDNFSSSVPSLKWIEKVESDNRNIGLLRTTSKPVRVYIDPSARRFLNWSCRRAGIDPCTIVDCEKNKPQSIRQETKQLIISSEYDIFKKTLTKMIRSELFFLDWNRTSIIRSENCIHKRATQNSRSYILIDEQHVNTDELSAFVDISGLPGPQKTNLRSVWAPAGSQISKESVGRRHWNRLLGESMILDVVWVDLTIAERCDIYSKGLSRLQWKTKR